MRESPKAGPDVRPDRRTLWPRCALASAAIHLCLHISVHILDSDITDPLPASHFGYLR
jgi:hypothetical protein